MLHPFTRAHVLDPRCQFEIAKPRRVLFCARSLDSVRLNARIRSVIRRGSHDHPDATSTSAGIFSIRSGLVRLIEKEFLESGMAVSHARIDRLLSLTTWQNSH